MKSFEASGSANAEAKLDLLLKPQMPFKFSLNLD